VSGPAQEPPDELVAERRELVRRMIGVMSKGMRPPSRAEFDQQIANYPARELRAKSSVGVVCSKCGSLAPLTPSTPDSALVELGKPSRLAGALARLWRRRD